MAEEAAATLSAMLGCPPDQAASYLEMTGGDIEAACSLYFDLAGSGGGMGGPPMDTTSAPDPAPSAPWCNLLLGAGKPYPQAWLDQGLAFSGLSLPQKSNGPCGALAAVQARLYVHILKHKVPEPGSLAEVEAALGMDDLLCVIGDMVCESRADEAQPFQLGTWAEAVGGPVTFVALQSRDDVNVALNEHVDQYTGSGCLLLILASCIQTRGVEPVSQDITRDIGEPPLIVGPNALCSFELMSLLLRGTACGNISAYTPDGTASDWAGAQVGLLSATERESGVAVANSLRIPQFPVWILHGGDHFTTLFSLARIPTESCETFEAHHFNGLPPAGPRMTSLRVTPIKGTRQPSPEKHVETFVKPRPGEIDDVVQARTEDKAARPKAWTTWSYEVVLAVDDPDVKGIEDPNRNLPVFPQGDITAGPWRCASCYAKRYETMCFGMNDDDAQHCQHCNKSRVDCGWSLWMAYDELPDYIRGRLDNRYGPEICALLRTQWPLATVDFEGPEPSV